MKTKTINFGLIIITSLLYLFVAFNTIAATQEDVEEEEEQEQDISVFTKCLENMKSFAVDFTQVDSKGVRANGTLLISKPHNFRCNYYPPSPLLIVGNQSNISMYDYEMQTLSRIKTNENVFNFLLMNHVDLTQHFDFEIIEDTATRLKVKLLHLDSDKYSEVIIDKNSNQLKEVKIFEANNIITISFNNMRSVRNFNPSLFILQTPNKDSGPERLSRSQLESQCR